MMRVEERERERERSVASRGSCSMYVFCSASPLVSSLSCHQFLFLSLYLFLRPSRCAAPLHGSPPRARCVHAPARGGEHGQAAYIACLIFLCALALSLYTYTYTYVALLHLNDSYFLFYITTSFSLCCLRFPSLAFSSLPFCWLPSRDADPTCAKGKHAPRQDPHGASSS